MSRSASSASTAPTTTHRSTSWRCARTSACARACKSPAAPRRRASSSTPTPSCPTQRRWPGCCWAATRPLAAPKPRCCNEPPWPCWAARATAALSSTPTAAWGGGRGRGACAAVAAGRVGRDEIGVRGPAAGEDASAAALNFGKRLSRDLYVTDEHSLSGTLGTLYIFYDLPRRLTLRGQTGAKSALDIIYTIRYD